MFRSDVVFRFHSLTVRMKEMLMAPVWRMKWRFLIPLSLAITMPCKSYLVSSGHSPLSMVNTATPCNLFPISVLHRVPSPSTTCGATVLDRTSSPRIGSSVHNCRPTSVLQLRHFDGGARMEVLLRGRSFKPKAKVGGTSLSHGQNLGTLKTLNPFCGWTARFL